VRKHFTIKFLNPFLKAIGVFHLGVNLGKGKQTALEDALIDYCKGFDVLAADADYITINISSPNTPNLRKLQESEYLEPLLAGIKNHRLEWSKSNNVPLTAMFAKNFSR
jgi:dihydroorotate dehydrogenase